IQIVHKIPPDCFPKRVEFCRRILLEIEKDESFLKRIWFSDESHFHLDGFVNKQIYRIWGTEKPSIFLQKSSHAKK
ncbi:hypothetical protein B4U79_03945, partial [Dinothrombium tinctorium]